MNLKVGLRVVNLVRILFIFHQKIFRITKETIEVNFLVRFLLQKIVVLVIHFSVLTVLQNDRLLVQNEATNGGFVAEEPSKKDGVLDEVVNF